VGCARVDEKFADLTAELKAADKRNTSFFYGSLYVPSGQRSATVHLRLLEQEVLDTDIVSGSYGK
jgi:hypothetical protein